MTDYVIAAEEIMYEVPNEHEDALVEEDDDNGTDSVNIVEGETSLGYGVIVPEVGMQFKD